LSAVPERLSSVNIPFNPQTAATSLLDGRGEDIELVNVTRRGVFGFNSRDRRSRSFNLLRSQVVKIMRARGWRTIGVTSATPGVGKSFIASNLAASMSRMPEQTTSLFDLDLRRGSIAVQYGLPDGVGVESYLSGEIDTLETVAKRVVGSGLVIYPSFGVHGSSAELLAGQRMRTLIDAMRGLGEDHLCICDLPPAFANDDASIVLQQIDAYLLVVEEGKTTARQVRDAIEVLSPAPCMGTVLNRYHGLIGSDDYGFGYGSSRNYDAYYS
jgi:Mrp family chromosome partitioning ATPase